MQRFVRLLAIACVADLILVLALVESCAESRAPTDRSRPSVHR